MGLPTRQDGVENRDKAKNSTVEVSDGIREPFFESYSKAVWLIRFSLNEIPSPGCDTLLALSTKYNGVLPKTH